MAHNYTNPAFLDEISTTPSKIHRTVSTRSFNNHHHHNGTRSSIRRNMFQRANSERKIHGASPNSSNGSVTSNTSQKYALVPLEDLNSYNKGHYAVVSKPDIEKITNLQRIVKSQENLDRLPTEDPRANLSDQFLNLPSEASKPLSPGFSSDFGSKYFIHQKRRYEVVPTEENEQIVDPNHEIVQMQNGRAHRYAVVPSEGEYEEETSLITYSTPPSRSERLLPTSGNVTPNIVATQKLYELLSTPQKQIREPPITPQSTPVRVRPPPQPKIFSSTPIKSPQYAAAASNVDIRTTAVISPRLQIQQNPVYSDTTWREPQKPNASMTFGAISLMLILTGILNASLSLYIISKNGRSYFLDMGTMAGFACMSLGCLGFKSRQCNWLPNRNYISGYLMVTIFSILDCGGLLLLLWLNPFPGFPLHDVTSGVILGLSCLTILVISLGVLSSKWCQRVPIDSRVDPV